MEEGNRKHPRLQGKRQVVSLQQRRLAREQRRLAREARRAARREARRQEREAARLAARLARRAARAARPRTKFWLRPYNSGTEGGTLLTRAVNGKKIRANGKYVPRLGDTVVNWGSPAPAQFGPAKLLNKPEAVYQAISKLRTFAVLSAAGVRVPDCTKDKAVAQGWLAKNKVVARDLDSGKGGAGIHIYHKGDQIVNPHLFYTVYYPKAREFRLHVFKDQVIFSQEKKRKVEGKDDAGADGANKYIRSHDRGWVFCHNHFGEGDGGVPEVVSQGCISAVKALGLDFGAVDVGWNEKNGYCVFEINTAPGIEGETVDAYAKALKEAA
jgi:hypothetical protein